MSDQNLDIAAQLIELGKFEQARPLLEQAIKDDLHNIRAWVLYANTCTQPTDKIRVWEVCLRHNAGNPQARQALRDLNFKPVAPVTSKVRRPVYATPKRRGSWVVRGLLWGLIAMLAVTAIVSSWLASFMPKNAEKYRHVEPVEYYLYVPKVYSADQEWPLFIGMHSIGGNGLDCWYLWQRFAEEQGFILLCPSVRWTHAYDKALGESTVWSAVTEIKKDYRIQKRMFLSGVLMGGLFAQDFACDFPGYVSGLALLSSPLYVEPADFPEPIPMLVVIGGKEDPFSRNTSLVFTDGLQKRGFDVQYIVLPDAKYAITPDEMGWTIDLFRKTVGKEPKEK